MESFQSKPTPTSQEREVCIGDVAQPKGQRLETATEISSNEYDEDRSVNSCRPMDLADPAEAPRLNDIQMRHSVDRSRREEMQNRHQIVRRGYVQKQRSSLLNKWQIRYCVLTLSKLYFFEDESQINMSSCINFNKLKCCLTRNNLTFTLTVEEYDRPITFRAYTEQEARWWQQDVGSIIQYHISSSKIRLMQSKKGLYQEQDAMTEKQFMEGAESGDVILMSTTDTQCAIQRFVTNSQYDHIALVVNFNGEIKIFESNADEGVNIYSWTQFQAEFHQYQKIAIRKLHYHKKNELHALLMKFIKSSIGKKYDLRALKLMRKTSGDEEEPGRGYFCSELVAKVYKKFGLLEREKASSSYWPVDFTARGGLNLFDSAFLGQERLIMLNKHVKYHS